jgi:hypothetical protein
MQLEHVVDLDLRYEGEYTIVRPHGGFDGTGYAAGHGTASGERVSGSVRFSNNPRVRGDGNLLAALSGVISAEDGARIVFAANGLGRWRGREVDVAAGVLFECDDERYGWLNGAFCVAEAVVRGRHVAMRVYECLTAVAARPPNR